MYHLSLGNIAVYIDYLNRQAKTNANNELDMQGQIQIDALKTAYLQSAQIVSEYGEVYLPIFERLDQEYQACLKQQTLLTKALSISKSIETD